MRGFYTRFYPYIKDYYFFFFCAICASALTAGCTASATYLVKPVLDKIFTEKDAAMLTILPMLFIAAYFGKSVGAYAQGFFVNYIGLDIVRRIREDVLAHMLRLDLEFFNKMRKGELIARLTNDIGLVRAAVSNYFADFVREGFTIIGLLCVVIYQNPRLAFYSLIVVPVAVVPILIIIRHIKRISRKTQAKNADITSKLAEVFNNTEIIKANNGEQIELEHYKRENLHFFKLGIKSTLIGGLNGPIMETLGAVAIGVVIFVGGSAVVAGDMTTGEFGSFTTALFMLYTPIKRVIGIITSFQDALIGGERIGQILDLQPKIIDGEQILQEPIREISVTNAHLHYDDIAALNGVSLEIKRNEIVALVGKSGSGKSSLVNMILRLYDPSSGEIVINGRNLKNFTQKSLRDHITIVTQRIFIFHDSIAANVAYGQEIDEARVIESLKKAQLWEFVEACENGIYTMLDEFGANLSGGQRQRIAIARAIYRDCDVIIFDEATSALDIQTEEAIRETIDSIKKDKIIILIAHRPSTISLAKRVYCMTQGLITDVTTPQRYLKGHALNHEI
ncbi:ABC transporter ATP-binding protein [uncultured Helicobacter sp.]|uniref:ABC transporter ATP-binding protein n=1 Tax=uncultured Helicobacter sp. TaxID=175537 RepID=UPI0026388B9B|nr:ABC transporter ATP-binding protein [uncultured Helicobacter sp.]